MSGFDIKGFELGADNYQLEPKDSGRHAVSLYFTKRSGKGNLVETDELRRLALLAPELRDALVALYDLRGQMEKPQEHAQTRKVFALVDAVLGKLP